MKFKLFALMLLPSIVFANPGLRRHQERPLLPADVARAESDSNRKVILSTERDLLLSIAKDTINDAVIEGKSEVSFRVTGYAEESVHAVNQLLRKQGYRCKEFYARLIGEYLDDVSWEK